MGWDAFSSVKIEWSNEIRGVVIVGKGREEFKQAALEVANEAGNVDFLLHIGALDAFACGNILEQVTGESVYNEKSWSSDFVKELNEKADWDFKVAKEDLWAYLSVKKFLELCAELDLRVKFSW